MTKRIAKRMLIRVIEFLIFSFILYAAKNVDTQAAAFDTVAEEAQLTAEGQESKTFAEELEEYLETVIHAMAEVSEGIEQAEEFAENIGLLGETGEAGGTCEDTGIALDEDFFGQIEDVTAEVFSYYNEADDIMQQEIDEAVREILSKIPAGASDRDKVRIIHDELCRRVTYDSLQMSTYRKEIYGALVCRRAVSAGYSKAFAYLCYCAGVPCRVAYGETNAWNVVMLNGEWAYCIDLTWDDTDRFDANGKEYIAYDNFLVTKEDLEKNGPEHVALAEYDFCTGWFDEEVGFWERNSYKMSSFTYDGVFRAFQTQFGLGRTLLEVRFDNDAAYQAACRALTENNMEMIWDILYGIGQVDGYEYVQWYCDDATRTFQVYLDYAA
ncbi:MAG: hypothetical protein IJ860_10500 [Eubacterium sp.]|nr:hypothetical protein [Eubacterium sp.]